MIKQVHSSHLGIESCLNKAKDVLFWLGMTAEIKDFVSKCETCNACQTGPLIPHDPPERPWWLHYPPPNGKRKCCKDSQEVANQINGKWTRSILGHYPHPVLDHNQSKDNVTYNRNFVTVKDHGGSWRQAQRKEDEASTVLQQRNKRATWASTGDTVRAWNRCQQTMRSCGERDRLSNK